LEKKYQSLNEHALRASPATASCGCLVRENGGERKGWGGVSFPVVWEPLMGPC